MNERKIPLKLLYEKAAGGMLNDAGTDIEDNRRVTLQAVCRKS
jgi:hypothetical protein